MWFWRCTSNHCPPILRSPSWAPHPWVDTSVNRMKSLSWNLRDSPWDTACDAHQDRWWMTQTGTVILWAQFSYVWSNASLAHHCMSQNLRRPLGTNGAIISARRHCLMMDWTLIHVFGRGATVKSWVLKCMPMKSNSWVGVSSDILKFMIHTRCCSTLMTNCTWNIATCGEPALNNQLSR